MHNELCLERTSVMIRQTPIKACQKGLFKKDGGEGGLKDFAVPIYDKRSTSETSSKAEGPNGLKGAADPAKYPNYSEGVEQRNQPARRRKEKRSGVVSCFAVKKFKKKSRRETRRDTHKVGGAAAGLNLMFGKKLNVLNSGRGKHYLSKGGKSRGRKTGIGEVGNQKLETIRV